MSRQPEPSHRLPVKADDQTTQDAFDWIDPSFSAGTSADHKLVIVDDHTVLAPLLHAPGFPPVTVMGRLVRAGLTRARSPKRADPRQTRCLSPISATDLLSTSTLWIQPLSSGLALTSPISPSLAAVSPARSYWIEGMKFGGDAE